ncbi:hypothetical protein BKP37_12700 [Anaerobacillus alkalilacustris]|uniref:Uncharacterized protein n=1 Tax=Anaerobacillus alkalilacustris TaxID=393763 RepID=A0A1S2LJV9_9BACI|nr:hypothetical protein [Anaerobacillus alkalilacustris]OIJ12656.1 hypothetical protein BKP37_12700 [Anaerobacillus alkalilacustris]
MIESEKGFDMLPYMVDIFDKLKLKEYIKKNFIRDVKGKNVDNLQIESGIDLFSYVLKNSPKIKEEFFNIVAIAEDKKIEEVKKQPLIRTISTIKEIFSNKELTDFFKQAMQ